MKEQHAMEKEMYEITRKLLLWLFIGWLLHRISIADFPSSQAILAVFYKTISSKFVMILFTLGMLLLSISLLLKEIYLAYRPGYILEASRFIGLSAADLIDAFPRLLMFVLGFSASELYVEMISSHQRYPTKESLLNILVFIVLPVLMIAFSIACSVLARAEVDENPFTIYIFKSLRERLTLELGLLGITTCLLLYHL